MRSSSCGSWSAARSACSRWRARLVERGQRRVDRLDGRLDQRRRLRARAAPAAAPRPPAPAPAIARPATASCASRKSLGDLLRLHHGGAPLGERGFLARLRARAAQLVDRMAQPVRLAARALDIGAVRRRPPPRARAASSHSRAHRRGVIFEPAEGIEQARGASPHRPARVHRAGRGSRPAPRRARAAPARSPAGR